jgi:hypothetical protein
MVIGADTPRVAVYEDGKVIFLKPSRKSVSYYQKRLSETELSEFKKCLIPALGLKDWKHFYTLRPHVTDQPETMLYLRDGERELATTIYGLRASGTNLLRTPRTEFPGSRKPDSVPDGLLELHKYLCSIDYPGSEKWNPKYVEVMIWPYEYAPDSSIIWPKDWPGLDSERTKQRGDSYSIFLDGKRLPELLKFLRTCKEKGAVKIAGKKWAVSWRCVFPSEPVWMKAFENSSKQDGKN